MPSWNTSTRHYASAASLPSGPAKACGYPAGEPSPLRRVLRSYFGLAAADAESKDKENQEMNMGTSGLEPEPLHAPKKPEESDAPSEADIAAEPPSDGGVQEQTTGSEAPSEAQE